MKRSSEGGVIKVLSGRNVGPTVLNSGHLKELPGGRTGTAVGTRTGFHVSGGVVLNVSTGFGVATVRNVGLDVTGGLVHIVTAVLVGGLIGGWVAGLVDTLVGGWTGGLVDGLAGGWVGG